MKLDAKCCVCVRMDRLPDKAQSGHQTLPGGFLPSVKNPCRRKHHPHGVTGLPAFFFLTRSSLATQTSGFPTTSLQGKNHYQAPPEYFPQHILTTAPWSWYCNYPHFTDRKWSSERSGALATSHSRSVVNLGIRPRRHRRARRLSLTPARASLPRIAGGFPRAPRIQPEATVPLISSIKSSRLSGLSLRQGPACNTHCRKSRAPAD